MLSVPDFARRSKLQVADPQGNVTSSHSSPNVLSNSYGGISSLWLNGSSAVFTPDPTYRKPLRLEALPTVEKRRKNKLNTLDLIWSSREWPTIFCDIVYIEMLFCLHILNKILFFNRPVEFLTSCSKFMQK